MTGPLRVAVNAIHAKTGGGVTYLRNMLPRLAADDRLAVELVAPPDVIERLQPLDPKISIQTVAPWHGFFGRLAWEQLVLPRLLRRARADVTFSPANYGPLFAPAPVVLLRSSFRVIDHEPRFHMRLYWIGLMIMTALSLMRAPRAIAVSDYARDALGFRRLGLAGRIAVIHHGVAAGFAPGQSQQESTPAAPLLLAVADLYLQKNLHTLIEAVAALKKDRPGLRLIIVGRPVDTAYTARLQADIKRLGLDDTVELPGAVAPEALADYYRRCTLFVFPSTVETFGNPLVEAMASGAPVVSSNSAAMPEILGAAGRYFDPLDAEDMARSIAAALDDAPGRAAMARRGIERANQFSWDTTARKTADVLIAAARR